MKKERSSQSFPRECIKCDSYLSPLSDFFLCIVVAVVRAAVAVVVRIAVAVVGFVHQNLNPEIARELRQDFYTYVRQSSLFKLASKKLASKWVRLSPLKLVTNYQMLCKVGLATRATGVAIIVEHKITF